MLHENTIQRRAKRGMITDNEDDILVSRAFVQTLRELPGIIEIAIRYLSIYFLRSYNSKRKCMAEWRFPHSQQQRDYFYDSTINVC